VVCFLEFIQLLTQFTAMDFTNVTTPNIRGKITKTRMVLAFQENNSSKIFLLLSGFIIFSPSKVVDNSVLVIISESICVCLLQNFYISAAIHIVFYTNASKYLTGLRSPSSPWDFLLSDKQSNTSTMSQSHFHRLLLRFINMSSVSGFRIS